MPEQNIPYGYCHCGCDQQTKISSETNKKYGWVKGKPFKYLVGHATRRSPISRFWEKVIKLGPADCWEWQASTAHGGYGMIQNGKDYMKAHRFSWEIHFGPIPENIWVLHKCDNRKCVNPNHLFLGTPVDNVQDMMQKGRFILCSPEKRGNAKLSEKDVEEIRRLACQGTKQRQIAEIYNISQSLVSSIILYKSHKNT